MLVIPAIGRWRQEDYPEVIPEPVSKTKGLEAWLK
jgi:hypothetical protein